MVVTLYNPNSDSGLHKLDDYLLTRSYITGYQASKDDIAVYSALLTAPSSKYVNVSRWYNHIDALLRICGVSEEGKGVQIESSAPVAEEAPISPPSTDAKAPATEEDDDDMDLFGEETEEEKKAAEERAAAVKASGKKKESGKSSVLLDVKPWDDETDMQKLEEAVRSVQMEGLLWGASKLASVGYGIKKLQIMMTIVDDLVSVDNIIEEHLTVEPANEYIQSCDIVAFNKISESLFAFFTAQSCANSCIDVVCGHLILRDDSPELATTCTGYVFTQREFRTVISAKSRWGFHDLHKRKLVNPRLIRKRKEIDGREIRDCGMAYDGMSSFQGVYKNLHTPAVIVGAVFALIALVLSTLLILQHLRSYSNPAEQKWIIAVLFMVPVYAAESIVSLWKSRLSIICDILRNCYEAFALYAFGRYLVACLGGERRVVELLENAADKTFNEQLLEEEKEAGRPRKSSFRDFFCHPTALGKDLYTIVKFGLVQYMILKALSAFLALLLELFGVYGDGEFKWYYGYPYIAVVLNFSQTWALYCLIQFYNVTHDRLEPIRPLAKFISFKAIVFATWWQGVGIAIICYFGILPKEGKIQNEIQDFLICIEMAIAAIAHVYVFSVKLYRYLPITEYGKITSQETRTEVKVTEGEKDKPAIVEEKETRIEAPGTSITESVQDVVMGGGGHVVKDVALTISQAIEPVEKGVTKIHETFRHTTLGPQNEKEPKVEIDEHITEDVAEGEGHVVTAEMKVETENMER